MVDHSANASLDSMEGRGRRRDPHRDPTALERHVRALLRHDHDDDVAGATNGELARHGELCFGCGQANIFGLQLELQRGQDGTASGRFFVKQDHQGADGSAHPGVVAAALADAMARCAGTSAPPRRLELDFDAPAPVGAFVGVEARVERRGGGTIEAVAHADSADGRVASARALFAA